MAIALDTTSEHHKLSVSNNISGSHTCTGTDLILLVATLYSSSSGDVVNSVTYNSVALTKIGSVKLNTTTQWLSLWYKLNPTTGTNTIAATTSVSDDYFYIVGASYTGVGGIDTYSTTATGSSPLTLSLTTGVDNAWLVSIVRSTDTGDQVPSTGTMERQDYAFAFGDSNGAKTPTGSYSMVWTTSGSKLGGLIASLSPAAGGATFTPRVSFIM